MLNLTFARVLLPSALLRWVLSFSSISSFLSSCHHQQHQRFERQHRSCSLLLLFIERSLSYRSPCFHSLDWAYPTMPYHLSATPEPEQLVVTDPPGKGSAGLVAGSLASYGRSPMPSSERPEYVLDERELPDGSFDPNPPLVLAAQAAMAMTMDSMPLGDQLMSDAPALAPVSFPLPSWWHLLIARRFLQSGTPWCACTPTVKRNTSIGISRAFERSISRSQYSPRSISPSTTPMSLPRLPRLEAPFGRTVAPPAPRAMGVL